MSTVTTPLLTPEDVAAILGIPLRTLGQWRYTNRGPGYLVVGRHVRYRSEDVDRWLDAQLHGGPDAAA